jgi:hypothetical protein
MGHPSRHPRRTRHSRLKRRPPYSAARSRIGRPVVPWHTQSGVKRWFQRHVACDVVHDGDQKVNARLGVGRTVAGVVEGAGRIFAGPAHLLDMRLERCVDRLEAGVLDDGDFETELIEGVGNKRHSLCGFRSGPTPSLYASCRRATPIWSAPQAHLQKPNAAQKRPSPVGGKGKCTWRNLRGCQRANHMSSTERPLGPRTTILPALQYSEWTLNRSKWDASHGVSESPQYREGELVPTAAGSCEVSLAQLKRSS